MQKRPPAWRQLRNADDLNRPEQSFDVVQPLQPCRHQVGGSHHGRRKRRKDTFLQACDRGYTRVLAGTCLQIDSRTPRLAESIEEGTYHAWQRF
jgi:hypothetical protein